MRIFATIFCFLVLFVCVVLIPLVKAFIDYHIPGSSDEEHSVSSPAPKAKRPEPEFPAFGSIKECLKCGGTEISQPQFVGNSLLYVCLVCKAGWHTFTKDYKPEPKKPETPEEAGRREVEEIAPNQP